MTIFTEENKTTQKIWFDLSYFPSTETFQDRGKWKGNKLTLEILRMTSRRCLGLVPIQAF